MRQVLRYTWSQCSSIRQQDWLASAPLFASAKCKIKFQEATSPKSNLNFSAIQFVTKRNAACISCLNLNHLDNERPSAWGEVPFKGYIMALLSAHVSHHWQSCFQNYDYCIRKCSISSSLYPLLCHAQGSTCLYVNNIQPLRKFDFTSVFTSFLHIRSDLLQDMWSEATTASQRFWSWCVPALIGSWTCRLTFRLRR